MPKLLDLDGFQAVSKELKTYIDNLVAGSIVQEDSFLKFPTIGSEQAIYIDTTTNKVYRWSNTELKYYTIGSDYNDIKIIDGNF